LQGNFHRVPELPVLSYILEEKGTPVSVNSVTLHELQGGKDA